MPLDVRWAQRASFDLAYHINYLKQRSLQGADNVGRSILATVETLREFPRIGTIGCEPDTREMLVTGYPYVIVYRITGQMLFIARVIHTAQNRDIA